MGMSASYIEDCIRKHNDPNDAYNITKLITTSSNVIYTNRYSVAYSEDKGSILFLDKTNDTNAAPELWSTPIDSLDRIVAQNIDPDDYPAELFANYDKATLARFKAYSQGKFDGRGAL